jgi:hypothetical protein
MPYQTRPTEGFLVDCVRAVVTGAGVGEPFAGLDWTTLWAVAQKHQVHPLLWDALANGPAPASMPAGIRDTFRLEALRHELRHELIAALVARLLAGTRRRGIPLLLLKGTVLARVAYPKAGHRGLGDLDLLVHEQDFAGLRELLEELGYRTLAPSLPAGDLPRYAHCYGQIRFQARRGPPIEVHFRLLNWGMPSATEPAWTDAMELRFQEMPARSPSPERFLLHLCLHAYQHGFALLRLFLDIALWQRAFPVQREPFAALAGRHRLRAGAYYALAYAEDLLQLPGLGDLRSALRPSAWRRRYFEALWQDRRIRALAAAPGLVEEELPRAFLLGEAPLREKLAFLRYVLFPPASWLADDATEGGRSRHLRRVLSGAWRAVRGVPGASAWEDR